MNECANVHSWKKTREKNAKKSKAIHRVGLFFVFFFVFLFLSYSDTYSKLPKTTKATTTKISAQSTCSPPSSPFSRPPCQKHTCSKPPHSHTQAKRSRGLISLPPSNVFRCRTSRTSMLYCLRKAPYTLRITTHKHTKRRAGCKEKLEKETERERETEYECMYGNEQRIGSRENL